MTTSTTTKAVRVPRISFRERDPFRIGVAGAVAAVVLLVIAFTLHGFVEGLSTYGVSATFTEAGGLKGGDAVRIAGTTVGSVSSVTLDGTAVRVGLQVKRGVRLPSQTRAEAKTATLLGTKYVQLVPAGGGALSAGDRIPLSRTRSAYDITQTLGELARTANGLDTQELAKALDAASGTFRRTPTELARTLSGLRTVSQSIASRDDELKQLFSRTADLSTQLNQRQDEIRRIVVDGNLLAAELVSQRMALDEIVQRLSGTVEQLAALVQDGRAHLTPALKQLRGLLALVERNRSNLDDIVTRTGLLARSLGDTIGSGPFYTAALGNILPGGGF